MIADLVSLGNDPFYQVGICLAILANDKECGFDVFLLENIQNLWRPDRIGPVIKCQDDLSGFVPGSLYHIRRRYLLVGFGCDLSGLPFISSRTPSCGWAIT